MSWSTIRIARLMACLAVGMALGAAERWEWTAIGLCALAVLIFTTYEMVERASQGDLP